ncbi:MAG: class II fumarate hydratase [Desulfocapsaceae bacterium]|nr:class II fumarate hydratase [Desulfocapsaceae bacterium]
MRHRTEKDTMGEVKVENDKLWGAQTQRSLLNFPIGERASMPIEIIRAFGYLKKAAAAANADLGVLSPEKKEYITRVCNEIIAGELDDHFPLVVWQTGSGTHTNMNVNEVIANRIHVHQGKQLDQGERLVHPNDDVNRSQSSNDTFPTAMHIAATMVLQNKTLPALEVLRLALQNKVKQFTGIAKIGRTHWMDATPLTLGQEFSGYLTLVENGTESLRSSMTRLQELALGGTAVGTGLNCPPGYTEKVALYITKFTGMQFCTAPNKFEALSAHNGIVAAHAALKQLAISLHKIACDIRQLASGPRCGLGELQLPANEPGSSIMPGKVNPSQVEALTMVCGQVIGNDVAIGFGSANGHFELNVYKPMIIANFLQSANLLGDAIQAFHDNCVVGIEPRVKQIAKHLENSLMLVTALTPHIGYEKAAEIAKAAHSRGTTLFEEASKTLDVDEESLHKWLNPQNMLGDEE